MASRRSFWAWGLESEEPTDEDRARRAEQLSKEPRPDAQKVDDLFWSAFGRAPSEQEAATALAHLTKHSGNQRGAFEDIIWALINAKEFQFVD